MKKKIVVLTLCFTILFSSININKSYADGGVISLPMLATVSALAVGTGIVINNNDNLYDLGKIFYDYIDRHNDLTWATVQSVFSSSVCLQPNKLVSVKSDFLDIVKGFFDSTFNDNVVSSDSSGLQYLGCLPVYPSYTVMVKGQTFNTGLVNDMNEPIIVKYSDSGFLSIGGYGKNFGSDSVCISVTDFYNSTYQGVKYTKFVLSGGYSFDSINTQLQIISALEVSALNFPYVGGYTWDNIESKKYNGEVALPIPGNLGQLVGQGSSDFWDNTDNLVGSGDLSIPDVNDPSIGLDGTTSFPNTGVGDQVACSECGMVGTHSSTCSKLNTGNPPIGFPQFPSWGSGIDFSPITQSDISDKFPFCLAKDLSNLIGVFDVGEKEPVFDVPFLGEVYTIDLAQFTVWADIIKFFTLITFIFGLIKITRGIIG